jgi:hypothetical protein
MKNKKNPYKKFLLDGLLIVLSVLFALFINKTAEAIKTSNETELALQRIQSEMTKNKVIISDLVIVHMETLKNIERILGDKNDSLRQVFIKSSYLDFVPVTNNRYVIRDFVSSTAWEAAKATNVISEFDYDVVEACTAIYANQNAVYSITLNKILDILYSQAIIEDERDLERKMMTLKALYTEIIGQETSLIELINKESVVQGS